MRAMEMVGIDRPIPNVSIRESDSIHDAW